MKKKTSYICAACKNEYEYGWSEEEAMKEAKELWAELGDNPVVICDDCFQRGIVKIN